MDKKTLENKEKLVASAIISAVYGLVLQLTKGLVLVPNNPNISLNVAIFVPAIAAILFGNLVGAVGAAGGQFLSFSSQSLLTGVVNGNIGTQTVLSTFNFSNFITMISDFIGAYIIGTITEKPESKWDNFTERFSNMKTWKRLGNNTLGSVIGLGLVDSLIVTYGNAFISHGNLFTAGTNFVELFFLNSLVVSIFVPLTLITFEMGDILAQVRAHRKDLSLRKINYSTVKEDAVTIITTKLVERAFSENIWTPIIIKFRSNMHEKTIFRIEAVSTANYYPAFDKTKPLEKGEVWEQKFFVLTSKQKNVDFKVRITPNNKQFNVEDEPVETILSLKGKAYNPNKNSITLVLFSAVNSLMVSLSIIWSNFVHIIGNVNQVLNSLTQSLGLLGATSALEAIVFVVFITYLRRKWRISQNPNLAIGFGMDLSARSQAVYNFIDKKSSEYLHYFKDKLQSTLKLVLVFVTLIAVLLLGVDGYKVFTTPNYTILYGDQLLIIGLLAIILWLVGFKGQELLQGIGLIEEKKYTIQEGDVITGFKPGKDFLDHQPNEVTFTVINPTATKGLRLRFLSYDTISPPLTEMLVPPKGKATFKTSITPIVTGQREILALYYPLFDQQGNYIDEEEAEPISYQMITYQVQSETMVGLSKDQESKLRKLLAVVLALGAIVYGSGYLVQQLFGSNITTLLRDNLPFLLLMQAPFIYIYFYLENNYKVIQMELENLLENVSTIEAITKTLDKNIHNSAIKSSNFNNTMKNIVQTELDNTITSNFANTSSTSQKLPMYNLLNEPVQQTIKTTIDSFTELQIKSIVQDSLTTEITNYVNTNLSSKIPVDIVNALNSMNVNPTNNLEEQQALPSGTNVITDQKESRIDQQSIKNLTNDQKQLLKQKIKEQLKNQVSDAIKEHIHTIMEENVSKNLVKNILQQINKQQLQAIKKSVKIEITNQIDQTLTDAILKNVDTALLEDLRPRILEEINQKSLNRNILSNIASELDGRFKTNYVSSFENAIGTDLEKEVTSSITNKLVDKYSNELIEKLNKKLRKKIQHELQKRSNVLIDSVVGTTIASMTGDKVQAAIHSVLNENVNTILETALDKTIENNLVNTS